MFPDRISAYETVGFFGLLDTAFPESETEKIIQFLDKYNQQNIRILMP